MAPCPGKEGRQLGLESADAVWCAEAGRSIIAWAGGAEIRTAATAVIARGDIEQRADVAIGIAAVIHSATIDPINAGNQGCGDAGATEH